MFLGSSGVPSHTKDEVANCCIHFCVSYMLHSSVVALLQVSTLFLFLSNILLFGAVDNRKLASTHRNLRHLGFDVLYELCCEYFKATGEEAIQLSRI